MLPGKATACAAPCSAAFCRLSRGRTCAHSAGVRLMDTTSEMTMAAASVSENSRNSRSMIPPMNSTATNTTTSATFSANSVKLTSPAPRIAAR